MDFLQNININNKNDIGLIIVATFMFSRIIFNTITRPFMPGLQIRFELTDRIPVLIA